MTKKKHFLKQLLCKLVFDIHPLVFWVEEPNVVALPLLPQQHVFAENFFQHNKTHVTQTVAPPIEVFSCRLTQVLVPNVACMLTINIKDQTILIKSQIWSIERHYTSCSCEALPNPNPVQPGSNPNKPLGGLGLTWYSPQPHTQL